MVYVHEYIYCSQIMTSLHYMQNEMIMEYNNGVMWMN